MLGKRTLGVVASVAATGALASPAAATDTSLVPTRTDVPGFVAAGGGAGVGRVALGGQVPSALRRAPAQGAAFRDGGRRLAFGVFRLTSPARAAAALRAAGRGGRNVRIGAGARLRVRAGRRSTDAVVVLRVGAAVGVVRLRLSERAPAAATAAAQAYATSLAARLRRGLALTAWDRTIGRTRADGSITPQIALQAFSLAYGPLPGVRLPAGNRGVPLTAGTQAVGLVARMWGRLTRAQRNAIDRKVGVPHDASSPRIARRAEKLTPSPAIGAKVAQYIAIYRTKIAGIPAIPVEAFKTDTEIPVPAGATGKVGADAIPVNAAGNWGPGDTYAKCKIRVPPFGQAFQGTPTYDYFLAHEAFHCVQFAITSAWPSVPNWIKEGTADWAAITVTKASADVSGHFRQYLDHAPDPLFGRSYDAMGFWGHVDEVFGPGSLWPKLRFVQLADSVTAFLLAGGGDLTSIETWASAMWRFPGAGAAWYLKHPHVIPYSAFQLPEIEVTNDATLTAPAYSTRPYAVLRDAKRKLVRIDRTNGYLRAGTPNRDQGPVDDRWFCFGTCECPKNEESSIPAHTRITGARLYLGLGASGQGGAGSVSYKDPKEYCQQAQAASRPRREQRRPASHEPRRPALRLPGRRGVRPRALPRRPRDPGPPGALREVVDRHRQHAAGVEGRRAAGDRRTRRDRQVAAGGPDRRGAERSGARHLGGARGRQRGPRAE